MTTRPGWGPTASAAADDDPTEPKTLSTRRLLRGAVRSPHGHSLGYIRDLAFERTQHRYPRVLGVLVCLGGYDTYLPADTVTAWRPDAVFLHDAPPLHRPADHGRDVLLTTELLGRRFTATGHTGHLRVRDLRLDWLHQCWVITTVDTRRRLTRRRGQPGKDLIDWVRSGQEIIGR